MRSTFYSVLFVGAVIALALSQSYDLRARPAPVRYPIDALRELPADLGALTPPAEDPENPITPAKVALGRRLFQETRLSGEGRVSCATCHVPEKAFTDGMRFSLAPNGKPMRRHTPTVLNVAYSSFLNWDGKFTTLRQHAVATIANPVNMNLPDESVLVARLDAEPGYGTMFGAAFGGGPTKARVGQAIEAYERSLTTPNSPFDRYAQGDKGALTGAQKRGLTLFTGKANCTECHYGPTFTDDAFHSLGIEGKDPGRFAITGLDVDFAAFKTPTLRNVSRTAPYMHNGSLATLRDVVDFYDAGGGLSEPKTPLLPKLHLTPSEKRDLVAFLESLTGV